MEEAPQHAARTRPSLFWLIFLPNAAVLVVAWAALAFTPATVRSPAVEPMEALYGLAGLAVIFVVNALVLRRALTPVARLESLMRTASPLRPGRRIPTGGNSAEVIELAEGFNDMLARLERERKMSATRAHEAQESERLRLAREIHDEIGQGLTAQLLELENASRAPSPEVAAHLDHARESARSTLEELRRIARRLRPEALEELGLRSALSDLAERVAGHTRMDVVQAIDQRLPELAAEEELAIYRVAQEALTNAMRHSAADRIEVELRRVDATLLLRVTDDGAGLREAEEGAGLTGMRERALMIGADLEVISRDDGGVEVELALPVRGAGAQRTGAAG